jgi:AcrR family transcriptional regulator
MDGGAEGTPGRGRSIAERWFTVQAVQRSERRLAAREGILAAAHRQVADGGWEAASVAAVAARAGVAAGSLYRHFASRDLLLAEVLRNAASGELALALRAAGPPERAAADRLDGVVRHACDRAARVPRLLRALWLDPLTGSAAAARADARAGQHRLLGGLAADGAARGAWPPPADPALTGAALFGALVEALLAPPPPPRGRAPAPSAAARADALAAFCLSAVRGPTPRAPTP